MKGYYGRLYESAHIRGSTIGKLGYETTGVWLRRFGYTGHACGESAACRRRSRR